MVTNNPEHSYVLVVGAAGIDSKGKAKGNLIPGSSTPGEVLVSVGGVARNIADNLARLGIDAVLLSAIGDDGSGKRILNHAAEIGIDTDYVIISDKHHTAAYLAILDMKGDLVMSVDDMEVLSRLTPRVINEEEELIQHAEMIVTDGNLSPTTLTTLLKLANRYGISVCADPTSTVLADKFKIHLPKLFMITPNIAEAEVLCQRKIRDESEAMEAARSLVNIGVNIVIITLAEKGVVYASARDSGYVPALATEIVDTLGASDALTATVVFGLLNEIPLDEAVRLGGTAAALTLGCSHTVREDLTLELLYDRLTI